MRPISCLIVSAVAFLGSTIVMAELRPEEAKEIQRLYGITKINIDGSANPELIPDPVRWKVFFYRYANSDGRFVNALKGKITDQDAAILAAYAATHAATLEREEAEVNQQVDEIMALATNLNGVELAVALEKAQQQYEQNTKTRYDELLSRLSAQGEREVRRFAYDRIRPSLSRPNSVAVASQAPALYKKYAIDGYAMDLAERKATKNVAKQRVLVKGVSSDLQLPSSTLTTAPQIKSHL